MEAAAVRDRKRYVHNSLMASWPTAPPASHGALKLRQGRQAGSGSEDAAPTKRIRRDPSADLGEASATGLESIDDANAYRDADENHDAPDQLAQVKPGALNEATVEHGRRQRCDSAPTDEQMPRNLWPITYLAEVMGNPSQATFFRLYSDPDRIRNKAHVSADEHGEEPVCTPDKDIVAFITPVRHVLEVLRESDDDHDVQESDAVLGHIMLMLHWFCVPNHPCVRKFHPDLDEDGLVIRGILLMRKVWESIRSRPVEVLDDKVAENDHEPRFDSQEALEGRLRHERRCYLRLVRDGGRPRLPFEQLEAIVRNPRLDLPRDVTEMWHGWGRAGPVNGLQVFSGQLTRWRAFRRWQRKVREVYGHGEYMHVYETHVKANLQRHGALHCRLPSRLSFDSDPRNQDQYITWLEYMAFETRFLRRKSWSVLKEEEAKNVLRCAGQLMRLPDNREGLQWPGAERKRHMLSAVDPTGHSFQPAENRPKRLLDAGRRLVIGRRALAIRIADAGIHRAYLYKTCEAARKVARLQQALYEWDLLHSYGMWMTMQAYEIENTMWDENLKGQLGMTTIETEDDLESLSSWATASDDELDMDFLRFCRPITENTCYETAEGEDGTDRAMEPWGSLLTAANVAAHDRILGTCVSSDVLWWDRLVSYVQTQEPPQYDASKCEPGFGMMTREQVSQYRQYLMHVEYGRPCCGCTHFTFPTIGQWGEDSESSHPEQIGQSEATESEVYDESRDLYDDYNVEFVDADLAEDIDVAFDFAQRHPSIFPGTTEDEDSTANRSQTVGRSGSP